MTPVLVDTSFLVGLYDKNDSRHARCLRAHQDLDQPLVTCEPVLTEAFDLLRRIPGPGQRFLPVCSVIFCRFRSG